VCMCMYAYYIGIYVYICNSVYVYRYVYIYSLPMLWIIIKSLKNTVAVANLELSVYFYIVFLYHSPTLLSYSLYLLPIFPSF